MGFKIHKMGEINDDLIIAFAKEIYAAHLQVVGNSFHERNELLVFNRFYTGKSFKTKVYYHCQNGVLEDMSDLWLEFLTRSKSKHLTFEFL